VAAQTSPDLLIIGQVTVDDVVPAVPGPWRRQMGGSSLYAVAGARLWIDPARIGLVARVGRDYPFDPDRLLRGAGLEHIVLNATHTEHLIEWLIYEPDGSRRSLPRNPPLLGVGAEGSQTWRGYQEMLLTIAPCAADVPASWLPAKAVHLCPQVGNRHRETLAALRHQVSWIGVDPSPHYSRYCSVTELVSQLAGATAFMPSLNEVQPWLAAENPETLVLRLHRGGFAEVALKRGAQPLLLASAGEVTEIPPVAADVVDPTGAGDAFCGAYAACRLAGYTPIEAARRAMATAALIVGCSGVEQALALQPPAI
jgi:sugar/nucleoside kinase (ribokinase family)